MFKIVSIIVVLMFLFGCQPSDSTTLRLGDPTSEKLIQLGAADSKSTRKLPYSDDSTVSYCEVNLTTYEQKKTVRQYSGTDDLKLYPAASLSKIYLTAFVIFKFGLEHQFTHTIKIKRYSDQSADVYLDSDLDPIYNIEKALYVMSLLQERGIRHIKHLYISQNTRVFLSVLSNPHIELTEVPVSLSETLQNFQLIFNSKNWGSQTQKAKVNLSSYLTQSGRNLRLVSDFSLDQVEVSDSNPFIADEDFVFYSAPMRDYLKEINVESNNYISDAFFNVLGGAQEFFAFQTQVLKLNADQLVMNTGSGLPVFAGQKRKDNRTTCRALIKALHYIKLKADSYQINLGDILLMPDLDAGTYDSQSVVINRSVVLKTGRLYDVPTLNLAGIASTGSGLMAFVFLGHNFDNADETLMKQKRDDFLSSLLNTYKPVSFFLKSTDKLSVFLD